MSKRTLPLLSPAGLIALAATGSIAVALVKAQNYAIDWYSVDGGGAGVSDASTGGSYTLSGTVGHPYPRNHPEPMTGGSYSMTGGFWVIPECPSILCDYDEDCDVDQADHALFEACASGPEVPHGVGCDDRDFNTDGDVDEEDFSVFQRCYTGENRAGDPDCAG